MPYKKTVDEARIEVIETGKYVRITHDGNKPFENLGPGRIWALVPLDNPPNQAQWAPRILLNGNVVCGFPGVGKSTAFNSEKKYKVSDSDSSLFDKSQFPSNYIQHIKQQQEIMDFVMVSTHKVVRDALILEEIPFYLVYPTYSLKDVFIQRYIDRGSPEPFIQLMKDNFERFVDECFDVKSVYANHIVITPDNVNETILQRIMR